MRKLGNPEIAIMRRRGCRAEDWGRILVADKFEPGDSFRRVYFSGDVRLGTYVGKVDVGGGVFLPTGVTSSRLHNATIGDNCRVYASTLANVDVGSDVIVEHVAELSREGEGIFGNGVRAHVLAEDGARSVPLWRNLSAQMAHLICHYKGEPFGKALELVVAKDSSLLDRARSRVGDKCLLRRTGKMKNVWIGDGVVIDGCGDIGDCYFAGGKAPARIGEGVSAEGCVFLSACRVESGVRLAQCLVGEGVVLEQSLFAEHSVFFANCRFKLGEVLSVMAGAFAESHHRATLALTCQCSFSTFGSGANASNHHFKLGPRHGGVLRRGTRCGSGSYLFWPCDIGAFSTVVGRHTEHLETADLPFSLLVSTGAGTVLIPGAHIFGIGVFRDAIKWQSRDRRGAVERPLDLVNAAVYSPYVMQSLERGLAMLRRSEGMEADLRHGGAVIPKQRIRLALAAYETGLLFYVGECILRHATARFPGGGVTAEQVAAVIRGATGGGVGYNGGRWRDWGGMLLCGRDADEFIGDVASGRLGDWDGVRERLEGIHAAYGERELEWAAWRWRHERGEGAIGTVVEFYKGWRKAVEDRYQALVKDAGKEFTRELAYGYGIESGAVESFRRIRGEPTNEPIVQEVLNERDRLLALAEAIK